ncbi:hypothetical protein C8R44DRAFT_769243 [Mycena epipterygia]|nr:hypothetical protein C8R44DRAFT_769243 [Mycena epipterygia]
MQAIYSTATDVKIHKAIRREWDSFQLWLFDQHRRLEYREHEILSTAQRKWGKMKKADKEQIHGLHQEFLAVARGEWLTRVRHSQLHLEHWVMTPDEKQMLQQTLGWTQKEMVDAYAQQQAEMGAMYQRVDPSTLGTKEPGGSKPAEWTSMFMHPPPKVRTDTPAYAKWVSELAKAPRPAASPHKPSRSLKSVELPSLPLYFVNALLQSTDLDAVAASDLENFALHASEEKIREYYAEACDASLHFQRLLPTLEASKREAAQADFDRRMRDLASSKEREWKAVTVKELRRHQAAEMERKVAQQRAMRPVPRAEMRREFRDWDYLDEYRSPRGEYRSPRGEHRSPRGEHRSPRGEHRGPRRDYFNEYQSPRRDYLEAYQSPQRDYLEMYQSPREDSLDTYFSPQPDHLEEYNSPRPRRIKRRPVPEEDYARGGIRSFAKNSLRNAGSRARRAAADWSSVKVDELDVKTRGITATRQRRGNSFIVRLDEATDQPAKREKLKKRRSEKEQTPAKKPVDKLGAGMGGAGRVFRRGVPDEEGKILAGETHVEPAQTNKGKSHSNQLRFRLGRPGFGLEKGLVDEAKGFSVGQKPEDAPGRKLNLAHAFKRVRFTPSTGSIGNLKRPTFRKLDADENRSKFIEGFGSKTSSAA